MEAEGRDCFRAFWSQLNSFYSQELPTQERLGHLGVVQAAYETFFVRKQHEMGHCFGTLYHVFKFVDQSDIPDPKRYTSIMRAQLSSYELALLFYNSLHSVGEGFKPLIEKYALLENADLNKLFNPEDHSPLYHARAFGN